MRAQFDALLASFLLFSISPTNVTCIDGFSHIYQIFLSCCTFWFVNLSFADIKESTWACEFDDFFFSRTPHRSKHVTASWTLTWIINLRNLDRKLLNPTARIYIYYWLWPVSIKFFLFLLQSTLMMMMMTFLHRVCNFFFFLRVDNDGKKLLDCVSCVLFCV